MTWELLRWVLIGALGLVFVAVALAEPGALVFGALGGLIAAVAFVKVVRIATDHWARSAR